MRITTQIKANAQEAIQDLTGEKVSSEQIANAIENMREITRLATRIDARTGTIDPSLKSGK